MADEKLEERLSVVETKLDYFNQSFAELKDRVQENHSMTSDLRDRVLKQNGLIPHMSEEIKQILSKIDGAVKDKNVKDLEDAKSTAETNVKVKVLWGLLAIVSTSLVGALIKLLS